MSSRLIVKNLPKKCNEQRLREHFATQGGEITDVRIMRKPDGSSRMFGFVGYKTEKMAVSACRHFNNTFLGTVRITVESALKHGDEGLPRPWSKHSKGSTGHALAAKRVTGPAVEPPGGRHSDHRAKPGIDGTERQWLGDKKEDPKLKEYLKLMRPKGSSAKFWAADGDVAAEDAEGKLRLVNTTARKIAVPNRKPGGEGLVVTKTHVTFEDSGDEGNDGGAVRPSARDDADDGSDDEYQDMGADIACRTRPLQPVSDLEYLRSKQVTRLSDEEEEEEKAEDAEKEDKGEKEEEDGDGQGAEDCVQEAAESGSEDGEVGRRADTCPGDEEEREDAMKGGNEAVADAGGDGTADLAAKEGQRDEDQDALANTGRLFLRNLSFDITEEDLKQLGRPYGPVANVEVPVDTTTKRGKGFAYLQFMFPEHAVRALGRLDGSIFQGRIVHVMAAKERSVPWAKKEDTTGPGLYKKSKEAERRANAQKDVGWSSLFMGSDAVAAATAEHLGTTKAALIGAEAEDPAVRLALAQTAIVQRTKDWFATHGLNVQALSTLQAAQHTRNSSQRSRTVILVKNLQPSVSDSALHSAFGKHGTIIRLLLPPARTVALVEFAAIPEAQRAFAANAYKKLGENSPPLFLEWAPQALLEAPQESTGEIASEDPADGHASAGEAEAGRQHAQAFENEAAIAEDPADCSESEEPEEARSLYVKNLNFSTDEAALKELFEKRFQGCPVRSVVIARKANREHTGKAQSMGYGFVEFATGEVAREVIKRSTRGKTPLRLDEHTLEIKLSGRTTGPSKVTAVRGKERAPAKGRPSRKLTVRNVAFEASKREMRELFAAFGELQSLRLPKKFDGSNRGFAFVEYLSAQDASKAMSALANTHFYGRHLVLEWAEDDRDLETRMEKSKRNMEAPSRAREAKRSRGEGEEHVGSGGRVDVDLNDQLHY